MAVEQRISSSVEKRDPTLNLRKYMGKRKVNGWLTIVKSGVYPYTDGHSRALLFKTPAAFALYQTRHHQVIDQICEQHQQELNQLSETRHELTNPVGRYSKRLDNLLGGLEAEDLDF